MFNMGSMKGVGRPARTALLGLVLLGLSASVDALTIEYCSSENTGSGFSPGKLLTAFCHWRGQADKYCSLQHIPIKWSMSTDMQ